MSNQSQSVQSRYAGFISYSQKDKVWAKRIHKALETYRLPIGFPGEIKNKKKLGRFFRDDDELSGAPSLGDALDTAIDGSNALIVICSPHSAKSKWVDAEIRRFKRRGADARVLAIIVGGRPDPEDPNEQCFPPSLLVKVNPDGTLTDEPDEPLAPDVRKDNFPRLITRLVAGLMDVEFDTLWQREKRRLNRWRIFASIAAIALITSFSGLYNWKQNQMAHQAKQATIREYNEKSELLRGIAKGVTQTEDYTLAELLALEGVNHSPEFLGDRTVNMGDALSHLARIKEVTWITKNGEKFASEAKYSPNGKYILTKRMDQVYIWDAVSGKQISRLKKHAYSVDTAEFSPDSQYVVTTAIRSPAYVWSVTEGEIITEFRGHTKNIKTAAFSPDGKYVVTASDDKTAQVWDAFTGDLAAKLSGHTKGVRLATFSKNQEYVLTASEDKNVGVWSMAGNLFAAYRGHTGEVTSAVFSPDGDYILTTSYRDKFAIKYDMNAEKSSGLYHEKNISSAKFSPHGSYILTSSGAEAFLWKTKKGKKTATLRHDADITSTAFSPNGRHVVTSSDDIAHIWDTVSGKEISILKGHGSRIGSVSYSPDGRHILTASFGDKTTRIWSATRAKIAGHLKAFEFSKFSADGKYLLVVGEKLDNRIVRIWDIENKKKISILEGSKDADFKLGRAVFSPNNQYVMTVTRGAKTAQIWTVKTGKRLAILSGHEKRIIDAVFSPDGRYVVTASYDSTARIWNPLTGDEVRVLTAHEYSVNTASFSPDGRFILTASSDKTARVWNADTGKEISVFAGHTSSINIATFSPDGKHVVSALTREKTRNADKTVRIWDAMSGVEISVLPSFVNTAEFSHDGRHVLTASKDGHIRIWDVQNGGETTLMSGHNSGYITAAYYSPDGRYVMSVSNDKTIRIWDTASGTELAVLNDHEGKILSAIYRPNGRAILSTSQDGTVRIWELPYVIASSEMVGQASARENENTLTNKNVKRQAWVFAAGAKSVLRCLTPEERKIYKLPADPPCWCQDKVSPIISVWEDDYLSRHPELMPEDGEWPKGKTKPNPFTHVRDDTWMCPATGKGYSAPWAKFEDLNALSVRDILGPANMAHEKLKTMNINH